MFANLIGLALTIACVWWARAVPRSDAWNMILIWGAPLLAFPITAMGRRILDGELTSRRAERTNVWVHYAMMIALGTAIFAADLLVQRRPGIVIPVPPALGVALVIVSGFAAFSTVLNLAVRGLGAPFAAKLSSRLAIDWMYAWTRNPMLLATFALLFALGLMRQSVWFIVWVAVSVVPGWIYFVARYEERELEIRFGSSYLEYKGRTPRMWPRRPQVAVREEARVR